MTDCNTNDEKLNHKKDEVCVIVAGSVDSGKSTTIGVLSYGDLDDGNGSARAKVAKHPHEVDSGKTSDISTRSLRLNKDKEIVIVDLCGHEKYLKTTLFGMTGYFPDYGILVVAANRGLLKMTREHLGIMLYMRIPFIIVVTRIDIAPKSIYEKTMLNLKRIMKRFNKRLVILNNEEDTDTPEKVEELKNEARKIVFAMKDNNNILPVISISNKTGYCVDVLRDMLINLKPRVVWKDENTKGSIFYIDSKFNPVGVGLVVSGVLKGSTIKLGQEMMMGPYGKDFIPIRVWSIHNNTRENINELNDRNHGCLAFRVLDKKLDFNKAMIRKGMLIISKDIEKNICYQFTAKIEVLNHSTTISGKYSPVIHCGIVRQTARIFLDQNQHLKMGDSAEVEFRFIQHPEFMEPGMTFFFREGTTRGVGTVVRILNIKDDPDPNPAEPKKRKKNQRRRTRPSKNRRNEMRNKNDGKNNNIEVI